MDNTTEKMQGENIEEVREVSNFVQDFISEDLKSGRYEKIHTRFPPEPNGYLHIGHAKAICIDFLMASKFGGECNLRFDDTNPIKEDIEYVEAIKEDIRWLGFDWEDRLYFASDYFERLYGYAKELISKGLAYVCDLTMDEIREYRGTLTETGKNSPCRNRAIEENLDLFEKMRAGEFEDGSKVLRAKIDMYSPNLNMRDPVIYRIRRAHHHRTGDAWCIYPMYDFQHPISDAIEGISHSLCSLEYEDHRPLYDWVVNNVSVTTKPRQIEFARLNLNYTVMSKRKLIELVKNNYVQGWDDPRMPTICGLRRRGFTPESIRDFCDRIGVAKTYSIVDLGMLEHCIREDLNKKAIRVMAVLNPIKVVIDNYPEDLVEYLDADNNTEDENAGTRKVPFSKVIYIESDDFMENPPKKYFRLSPGMEVRLKHAYFIKFESLIKDENGEITEIHCTYDPATRGGNSPDGRKVKGTIQWVSEKHAVNAEVRLYDNLFTEADPDSGDGEYKNYLNANSLTVLKECKIEPVVLELPSNTKYQFIRTGYFCEDSKDSTKDALVFGRIVALKDSWAKINK